MDAAPASLCDHLGRLCQAMLRAGLAERQVRLLLVECDIDLDAWRCWRVGLIVSELVTNAARHGLGGRGGAIVVGLDERGGTIRVSVSDNGCAPPGAHPGRGTRIVEALAEELGGSFERRFTDAGTVATLSFPR
jgi:two-component sensor histidine kinase